MHFHSLVHIFHPSQTLPAACSVIYAGMLRGDDPKNIKVHFLINHPALLQSCRSFHLKTIGQIITALGWDEPSYFDYGYIESALFILETDGTKAMRSYLQDVLGFPVNEFHYAHNMLGRMPEVLMTAFSDVPHYTFGDALGSIYNKGFHLGIAQGKSIEEAVHQGRNFAVSPDCLDAFDAFLILPIDQTGDMLPRMRLKVVPKELVLNTLARIVENLDDLNRYCLNILKNMPEPHTLFLSECIHEMQFTDFQGAVDMQKSMIEAHAPQGGTLIIKSHPVTLSSVDQEIADYFSKRYAVHIIPREYAFFPVELFSEFVNHCEVLSWSYSTLSLSYLYNKQVRHCATDSIFGKYLFPERLASMQNSNTLILGPLSNLDTWDGHGPLYTGNYPL